ncbi:MAG: NADH-quinone oxidoreductase subunit C [Anaerolineales bacterium]|nr:NADH-quinone oxidoreductase subunit C [Anaerolineales bacterium]
MDKVEERIQARYSVPAIVNDFRRRFECDLYEFRDEASLILGAGQIVAACQALRDEYDFELLVEETAVDYWPQQTPRFHIVYRLRSLKHNLIIGLRVPLDGNAPSMPTLTGLYANANWFERELWDMFGVRFEGHPDLRRVVMPYDWEGHPLRKDYPLSYEEVQFTFNFDEIDVRKPYATE